MKDNFHFVLLITSRCNLSCKHCDTIRGDSEMAIEMLERIVDYKPKKVNLMGGEPLLHSKFESVLGVLEGIPVTIQTNATLIPKKIKSIENVRQVICSVEGMGRATDSMRGKGVWNKVVKAVDVLKEHGVPVLLRSSIWENNLIEVPEMVKFAREKEVGIYFYPMLGLPPLNFVQQKWFFEVLSTYDNAWLDLPSYFSSIGRDSYCAAAESRLAFKPDGGIVPCQWFLNYELGYVGDSFGQIEENADFFAENMKHTPLECAGCYRSRSCRGGCMLVPWYLGCPQRPIIKFYLESKHMLNPRKVEVVRRLLSNVVTC